MRRGSIEARAAAHAAEVVKAAIAPCDPNEPGAMVYVTCEGLRDGIARAFTLGYHAGAEDESNRRAVRK